jgi:hypothetical protein
MYGQKNILAEQICSPVTKLRAWSETFLVVRASTKAPTGLVTAATEAPKIAFRSPRRLNMLSSPISASVIQSYAEKIS